MPKKLVRQSRLTSSTIAFSRKWSKQASFGNCTAESREASRRGKIYFHCHEKLSFRGDIRRVKENNGVSTTQPGRLASFTQRTDDFTCSPVLLMPPANNSDLCISPDLAAFP